MPKDIERITVREAITLFPELLDEEVRWGMISPSGAIKDSKTITFQFVGDGNYRTGELHRIVSK